MLYIHYRHWRDIDSIIDHLVHIICCFHDWILWNKRVTFKVYTFIHSYVVGAHGRDFQFVHTSSYKMLIKKMGLVSFIKIGLVSGSILLCLYFCFCFWYHWNELHPCIWGIELETLSSVGVLIMGLCESNCNECAIKKSHYVVTFCDHGIIRWSRLDRGIAFLFWG